MYCFSPFFSYFKFLIATFIIVALLPGPGSYEVQVKEQLKFDKTPMPLLRPKTNRGKSRQKLDFENLEIIKDPNALFDGNKSDI